VAHIREVQRCHLGAGAAARRRAGSRRKRQGHATPGAQVGAAIADLRLDGCQFGPQTFGVGNLLEQVAHLLLQCREQHVILGRRLLHGAGVAAHLCLDGSQFRAETFHVGKLLAQLAQLLLQRRGLAVGLRRRASFARLFLLRGLLLASPFADGLLVVVVLLGPRLPCWFLVVVLLGPCLPRGLLVVGVVLLDASFARRCLVVVVVLRRPRLPRRRLVLGLVLLGAHFARTLLARC